MRWFCFGLLAWPLSAWSQSEAEALEVAIDLIGERFPEAGDDALLYREAIRGLTSHLDKGLGFSGNKVLTEAEIHQQRRWLEGERIGIGVEYRIVGGQGLLITEVFGNSPADRAGVVVGDMVVAMADHPFTGRTGGAIHALMNQVDSSEIVVDLRCKEGKLRRIELSKGPYYLDAVTLIEGEEQPGLRIQFFGDGAAEQARDALRTLSSEPALMLDLRDNKGGHVEEMLELADLFLEAGAVVMQTHGYGGQIEQTTVNSEPVWSGELVVLVNRGTEGLAEAFVGALQDHRVASLVGTRTAGVATYESFHSLGAGLVLQLTDGGLRSPSGRSWGGVGIEPDILVEVPELSLPGAKRRAPPDLQRDAAIRLIRNP